MDVGRCIKKKDDFLGCSNDVLSLLDQWCSGRQQCQFFVTNDDLEEANTNCLEILIKYLKIEYSCLKVVGCSELVPPAQAWYKRDGSEAVIGCDNNEKKWQLTCVKKRWVGDVGNCTEAAPAEKEEIVKHEFFHMSSIVVISGIAGIAIVLSVVAIVIGTVYINKYRMKQEIKRANLYKTYSTIGSNVQAYYRPVTVDQSEDNATCWDMSLVPHNQMALLSDKCTCPTLQMRNQGNGDKTEGERSLERQSLYSSIRST
ncbi:hypothetical protein LSH36_1487g00161 [Paralvinella palmiformis]|uniref:Uncharacterized protein n=1 Tax=Paralvinella palmiformis TaxID=53620 RepID=A0AAD9MQK1_9ANNE|nr:hypothetical protein LSH36_1487g00161 [Paralvinella palmiformis]